MVDRVLLEQVLQLGEPERRELWAMIDSSFDDGYVSPEVAAIIDQRIAEADAHPDDLVTLDEDRHQWCEHLYASTRSNEARPGSSSRRRG